MGLAVNDLSDKFIESVRKLPNGMYEAENFSFDINPQKQFALFEGTVWFETYIAAAQYLWYVKADRDDDSIEQYMPSYKVVKNNESPFHNSNYGYYFHSQMMLQKCVDELIRDKESRRACIMINNNNVAFSDQPDKLCTNSISFRIRDMALNMTVHMRSNDFLEMMPYDVFQFCMVYGIVYSKLKLIYPELRIGKYHHCADSMHTSKINYIGLKTYNFRAPRTLRLPDFASPTFEYEIFDYMSNFLKFHNENCKNA